MFLIFQVLCNSKVFKKIELSKNISLVPLKGEYFNNRGHAGYLSIPSFIFIQKFNEDDNLFGSHLADLKAFLEFYTLFFDMPGGWSINSFDLGYTKLKFAKTTKEIEKIKKEMQSLMYKQDFKFEGAKINPGLNNIKMDFGFFKDPAKDVLCKCKIEETWDKFLLLSEKERNQISLHLFNPLNSPTRHSKVYSNEALPIGLQFSVLESLIGKSKNCSNILKHCSSCDRHDLRHDEQSIRKFMESELNKYLHFSDNEKYIELIIDLWVDVRNDLFHNADNFQSSVFKNFTEKYRSIEISDIDVKKERTHREDSLHYENSLRILKSTVRVIILSKFFSDNEKLNKNWPDILLFKSTTISG